MRGEEERTCQPAGSVDEGEAEDDAVVEVGAVTAEL